MSACSKPVDLRSRMPELGTSGSVRDRDGQPPGLLDLRFTEKAYFGATDKHLLRSYFDWVRMLYISCHCGHTHPMSRTTSPTTAIEQTVSSFSSSGSHLVMASKYS